ncbi:MAG: hypothetical protein CEN89_262 [Candidatus Berkelbacteria bacterium Licking1014_7]|uniref:Polymerase nucleotidyl transferase domain-containing protein n=1 Tax=Candidatus Berkelbacteria bacterium Licking1014_7 TaxID=2017147 RepID=A0A554LKC1_9BACT|nr:MAG: hypothetical protein CEN89_262 [Candidatus Berkelbacteria bacterium Licking1014_7]
MNKKLYQIRLSKARRFAQKIGRLPYVKMVALIGSMANGKANNNSDIDFFIQTAPKRIWTARFFILLWLLILGERPTSQNKAGKICLSWWADFDVFKKKRIKHQILFEKKAEITDYNEGIFEKALKFIQIAMIKNSKYNIRKGAFVRVRRHEIVLHGVLTDK